ncbi:MAG: hypothetical protein K0Q74_57 [Gammaproteobacteria bacterium]|jgi:hypothetical protein|nr:hypothetical protein [Gammaproteobacteria bacterium]
MVEATPRTMKIILLTLAILFLSTQSLSAEKNVYAKTQAEAAFKLWTETCLYHRGNYQTLTLWARANNLHRTDPSLSQEILQGEKGEVWQPSKRSSNLLLILNADDQCAVWATRADATDINNRFERSMANMKDQPKLAGDKTVKGQDGEYRQIAYYVRTKSSPHGWAFIATTSDSDNAAIHVRLTVSPAGK